jgi:hypothetical protein
MAGIGELKITLPALAQDAAVCSLALIFECDPNLHALAARN